MNQVKLTPSQEQAIESQKRIARMVHGDNVTFQVLQPRNTDKTVLICEWTGKNMLGGELPQSASWTIGKRGKVRRCD